MHTTSLPSIATQQAEQIRQLKGQVARLSQSLQAADEHITRLVAGVEIARCHALNDPNGRLSRWLKEYDAWLKGLAKC